MVFGYIVIKKKLLKEVIDTISKLEEIHDSRIDEMYKLKNDLHYYKKAYEKFYTRNRKAIKTISDGQQHRKFSDEGFTKILAILEGAKSHKKFMAEKEEKKVEKFSSKKYKTHTTSKIKKGDLVRIDKDLCGFKKNDIGVVTNIINLIGQRRIRVRVEGRVSTSALKPNVSFMSSDLTKVLKKNE